MISHETVRNIAKLARLSLSKEEEELYTQQLGKILDYFEALNAINTTDVEPMSHALKVKNVMREDELIPTPGQKTMLSSAPDCEDGFFRVPKIGE
jgi:aspartyl-tRNA(Asn)/glutamyl-tRNA(Gln) amidotransferase subunit C